MDRRQLLGLCSAAAATVAAGCVRAPTTDPDRPANGDAPTGDPTPDLRQVRIDLAPCANSGSASVTFDRAAGQVVVRGCVTGETACHYPEVASAGYDGEVLQLVVAPEYQADDDEACAQVLTDRGYRVEATFDGDAPRDVEIVHDDVHGREFVATATR
ncbi:hypothetical protein JCM17823_15480 [Halorubrum gandharaense]